jgi:hypothetical protein
MDTKVTVSRPDWATSKDMVPVAVDTDMMALAVDKILYDIVDNGRINLRGRTVTVSLHEDGQHATAELLPEGRMVVGTLAWTPHVNQIGKRFRPVDVVNLPGENQD